MAKMNPMVDKFQLVDKVILASLLPIGLLIRLFYNPFGLVARNLKNPFMSENK
jgi:hypothetical protein